MNISEKDMQLFLNTIKTSSNYDLSEYSEKSLKRRLAKVLLDNKKDLTGFVTELKSNKDFLEKIIKEITVNTTELFRDPPIWHILKYKVLPKYKDNKNINIWHAGCSSGQEVYSLMMLLNELGLFEKAKIYGTDINNDVLETAANGTYKYRFNIGYLDNFDKVLKENPYNYEDYNDIPYSKYFEIDKARDTIKMHPFLTEKGVFKKHDLVTEDYAFFIKFDIIFCRNVIIYFNHNLQNKIFTKFHNNLYDEGCLVLGLHETILGTHTANFEKKEQVYFKKS